MSSDIAMIMRVLLGLASLTALVRLFLSSRRRWTNPFFLYVAFSLVLYINYALGGAYFDNGYSLAGEIYYLISLAVSCVGYRLACLNKKPLSVAPIHRDTKIPRYAVILLIGPMLVALVVLLFRLTSGNFFQLFDLSFGNALKWLRITEKDPVVYVSEAFFWAAIGIVLPAAVLLIGQKKPVTTPVVISVLAFVLYLLSTGSRSPVVTGVLMLIPSIGALKQRGLSYRRVKRFIALLALASLAYFGAVSSNRDAIDDNGNDALRIIFNAKSLGYFVEADILPYSLQLPLNVIFVYFSSTFNNYIIIFQNSVELENSYGYRLFYTELKGLSTVVPVVNQTRNEAILANNTELLRTVSPSGDQWAMSLGTLMLEFGLFVTIILSFFQGVVMGWLTSLGDEMGGNRKIILDSFLVPFAISAALVHPLMAFATHIQLILLFILFLATRTKFSRQTIGVLAVQRP